MNANFKIDFIGIGSVRCGTSWMANILKQHPGVCFSTRKEVMYFNKKYLGLNENDGFKQDLSYYRQFWPKNIPEKSKVGEFSPQYLCDEAAAEKINKHYPDTKLIAMLRNPVDRAYSHFLYDQLFKEELSKSITFEDALKQFPYFLNLGNYGAQLKRFMNFFSKEQIKIFIYEDLGTNTDNIIHDLYEFICVDSSFYPNNIRAFNESREVKYQWMNKVFRFPSQLKESVIVKALVSEKAIQRLKQSEVYQKAIDFKNYLTFINSQNIEKTEISQSTKIELKEFYLKDTEILEGLINRDLSIWKN